MICFKHTNWNNIFFLWLLIYCASWEVLSLNIHIHNNSPQTFSILWCLYPASGDFLPAKKKILREILTSQSKFITILEFSRALMLNTNTCTVSHSTLSYLTDTQLLIPWAHKVRKYEMWLWLKIAEHPGLISSSHLFWPYPGRVRAAYGSWLNIIPGGKKKL